MSLACISCLSFPSFTLLFSDYAIVSSDSGRIVILEYDPTTSSFVKLPGDVREVWRAENCSWVVPSDRPKGTQCHDSSSQEGEACLHSGPRRCYELDYLFTFGGLQGLLNNPSHCWCGRRLRNPLFTALEVDYSESNQDPTGEALNNAEKVTSGGLTI